MSGLSWRHISPIYNNILYKDLPKDVVDKTKLLILHNLASACSGRQDKWSLASKGAMKDMACEGNSRIWFSSLKGNEFEAAFVNCVMSQSNLQEDVHRESATHPGIIIIPCAFWLWGKLMTEVVRMLLKQ